MNGFARMFAAFFLLTIAVFVAVFAGFALWGFPTAAVETPTALVWYLGAGVLAALLLPAVNRRL